MASAGPRQRNASSSDRTASTPTVSPILQNEANRNSRVLCFLTILPLALAVYAFVLQSTSNDYDLLLAEQLHGRDNERLPGWRMRSVRRSMKKVNEGTACKESKTYDSFPHQKGWTLDAKSLKTPRLCITVTTAASLDQILPWLFYHKSLGVDFFILFVEGNAAKPNSTAVLGAIQGVKLVFRTKELEDKQAKSRIWNETWLSSFFFRPCNYELFVRQSLNMEMAISMARKIKADWILHIDTDELLYPAGYAEYSLQWILGNVAKEVDTVVFPNYESAVENEHVADPFLEVTMFKRNYDHMSKDVYFAHYREATRGNPNYFLTYGNGKSAARMKPNLRPNGAHRWHNYAKPPLELKLAESAVLHYTYSRFSDLTSRRDRCGCKPTAQDVKKCFMLDFDRVAFIIASTQSKEGMLSWYRDHVVWTDPVLNQNLLKFGILGRIYTPQIVMKGVLSSGVIEAAIARGQRGQDSQQGSILAGNETSSKLPEAIVELSLDSEQNITKTEELFSQRKDELRQVVPEIGKVAMAASAVVNSTKKGFFRKNLDRIRDLGQKLRSKHLIRGLLEVKVKENDPRVDFEGREGSERKNVMFAEQWREAMPPLSPPQFEFE